MKKILFIFLLFLLIPFSSYGGTTINPSTGDLDVTIDIQEEDGSPIIYAPDALKVPNDSLTDNEDGTASLNYYPTATSDDKYIDELGDSTGDMTSDLNIDSDTLVISYDDNKVGIGTSAPSEALEVTGDARISDDSPHLELYDSDGPTSIQLHYDAAATYRTGIWYSSDGSAYGGFPLLGYTSDHSAYMMKGSLSIGGSGNSSFGSDVLPTIHNTYDLGSAANKWADVQAVLLQGSDYGFANGWILREYPCTYADVYLRSDKWMKENANKGIQVINDEGEVVCVIGRDGTIYANAFRPLSDLE